MVEEAVILLPVAPVAKPRMTRSDKWNERDCVVRYRAFKDALRKAAKAAGYELGPAIRVIFCMPMPASWSQAKMKRMNGQPHQQKPDCDNMIKGLLDCLLPNDDAGVWRIDAQKRWSVDGAILIENIEGEG